MVDLTVPPSYCLDPVCFPYLVFSVLGFVQFLLFAKKIPSVATLVVVVLT